MLLRESAIVNPLTQKSYSGLLVMWSYKRRPAFNPTCPFHIWLVVNHHHVLFEIKSLINLLEGIFWFKWKNYDYMISEWSLVQLIIEFSAAKSKHLTYGEDKCYYSEINWNVTCKVYRHQICPYYIYLEHKNSIYLGRFICFDFSGVVLMYWMWLYNFISKLIQKCELCKLLIIDHKVTISLQRREQYQCNNWNIFS